MHKLVQLRCSNGYRARCFLGDLRQNWCILRDDVMGFFPAFPRIQKQVWVPGMCFDQLAHSDFAKKIVKISTLSYLWMKHIMSPPKKKFDLESVKEFIGNVGRKAASNPKLSLALVFLLAVVLAVSLILTFKLGQESSETKGSQSRCR